MNGSRAVERTQSIEAGNCSGDHDSSDRPHLAVGITCDQTALILRGRLRSLVEQGFRVTLICNPGEALERIALEEGVAHCGVPMVRDIALLEDLHSFVCMLRVLTRLRPDVVEFSTPKAGLLGLVAARLTGVPLRIYLLRGLKLETAIGWKRRVLLFAERITVRCSHAVLSNSSSLRKRTIDLGIAPAKKLTVLGDGSSRGVDVQKFAPGPKLLREQLGIPSTATVIGFVGRLTRDKGIPELLDAFEQIWPRHPQSFLLLVGWFDEAEDALKKDLCARILNHPRVLCTGLVMDTAPYYRAMDIFVLPTLREGFPNAVLEASASELPVVTTLATGARDSVLAETTGILVEPGCSQALTDAILRLVQSERLRRRMGRAGREWVCEKFQMEHMLRLNADFYREHLDLQKRSILPN